MAYVNQNRRRNCRTCGKHTIRYVLSDKMCKLLEPYRADIDKITENSRVFKDKPFKLVHDCRSIEYQGQYDEPYTAVFEFSSIDQMISTLCDDNIFPTSIFKDEEQFHLTSVNLETLKFSFHCTYLEQTLFRFIQNILHDIDFKKNNIIDLKKNFHVALPTIFKNQNSSKKFVEFFKDKGIDIELIRWKSIARLHFQNYSKEDDIFQKLHQYLTENFTTKEIIIDFILFLDKDDHFYEWFTVNYRAELNKTFVNYGFNISKFLAIDISNKYSYSIFYSIPNDSNTRTDELDEFEDRILRLAPGVLYFLQTDTIWKHFVAKKLSVHYIDFEFDDKIVVSGLKKDILFLVVYVKYFTSNFLHIIEKNCVSEPKLFINLQRNENILIKRLDSDLDTDYHLELKNHKAVITVEKKDIYNVNLNGQSFKFDQILRFINKEVFLFVCKSRQFGVDKLKHPNFENKYFMINYDSHQKLYAIHKSEKVFEMYKKMLADSLKTKHKVTKDKVGIYIWYYDDDDTLETEDTPATGDENKLWSKIWSLTSDFFSKSLEIRVKCDLNIPAYYYEDLLNDDLRDVLHLSLSNEYGIYFLEHYFYLYFYGDKQKRIWTDLFTPVVISVRYDDLINNLIKLYASKDYDLSNLMNPFVLKQMLNADPTWCSLMFNQLLKGEVKMNESNISIKGVKFHAQILDAYLVFFSRNIVALKVEQFYISRTNLEKYLKQYFTQFYIFDTKPYYSLFTTTVSLNQVTIVRGLTKVIHVMKIENPLKKEYLITKKDSYASLTQPFNLNCLSKDIITIECLGMHVEEIEKFIDRSISCRVLNKGNTSDEHYREFEKKMKEKNFLVVYTNEGLEVAGLTADIIDEMFKISVTLFSK